MKITTFILLTTTMMVSASLYSQNAKLSLKFTAISYAEMFQEIESQTEFIFAFSSSKLDPNEKVELDVKKRTLEEILNKTLPDEITYEIVDRYVVIMNASDKITTSESQQQKTIKGLVVDESGLPLPGVTVLLKGTTKGTVTNNDGNYSISDIPENTTLVFSFVGMKMQEIIVGSQSTINVTLEIDAIGIEEVVTIGYGTQKKSDLTGAVFSVKADALKDLPNTNIMEGLQGKVPGLVVTNSQSAPGTAPQIRIRGENSLSASNNPLIILDGIPFTGNINDISPNDIASASVLKDASASAIYGARAANGVIIITTKRGKKGEAKISYNGYYGVQTAEHKLDMMSGTQYFDRRVDVAKYQGNITDFSPEALLNKDELPNYYAGIETDWQNMMLRTAPQQEHNVSISGGSDKTNYYTSFNFLNQEGIVEYSGMKRFTLRSNVDHQINDWLKTGVNIQLTNKDLGGSKFSNIDEYPGKLVDFQDGLRLSPYGKVKDETGRYTHYPEFPNTYYGFTNPFGNDGATLDNETKRAIVNFYGEINIPFIKGLSYRMNYGIDYNSQEIGSYYPSYTYYGYQFKGVAETENNNAESWTWENIIKYTKDISDHHIDFTGLFSREGYAIKTNSQSGKGFVNDDNLYHYVESADNKEIYSSLSETDLVSYMGRINYNFYNKYFITGTGRVDGYSGFGANNKYAFFPSVALGWIPTQEKFMQNAESLKFIDYLKIRASLGENGNMGIAPYQTLDQFRTRNYVFGNNPSTVNGLDLRTVGNPDLKWESTITFNIGLDYAVLENRISGNLDFYLSHSNDLLMTRQLPVMNGYTSIWYNIGETKNQGFEFNLNTINIQKSEFEWTTNFNFSLNRDEIVALRGDGKDDVSNKWFIGEPLRVYYDYKQQGIWQTGDDIAGSASPSAKPGQPRVEDTNPDGKIDGDDRVILGSRLPSWVGGMTNNFSYNNWTLSVYMSTVQGILKSNSIQGTYTDLPYWREDRPSNVYAAPGNNAAVSPGFYQDADYVRIRDLTLSYNFSDQVLEELGIDNLRLYLSGKNLYTFTDWVGYNPEAGNSLAPYPNSRTIVMGINLSF